ELYNAGAGNQYPFVTLPSVSTDPVTDITATSATGNGEVTNDGGADIIRRGFVRSTSPISDPGDVDPDTLGLTVIDETGTFGEGEFDLPLGGSPVIESYYFDGHNGYFPVGAWINDSN